LVVQKMDGGDLFHLHCAKSEGLIE
jgi:hypothetical protein